MAIVRHVDNIEYCPICEAQIEGTKTSRYRAAIDKGVSMEYRLHLWDAHGRLSASRPTGEARTPGAPMPACSRQPIDYRETAKAKQRQWAIENGYADRLDTVLAETGPVYGTRLL